MIRVIKPEGMGNIQLEEVPIPKFNSRQVLVRTAKTLISRGSELFRRYIAEEAVSPSIMGYSLTGIVEEIGSEVTEYHVGQRVMVVAPHAQYAIGDIDSLVKSSIMPLTENISFEEGTFIEPLGCTVRGQRRICLQPGDSVLVLGSGLAGLLNIRLARALGAGCIVSTDLHPFRLQAAIDSGARAGVNAGSQNVIEEAVSVNDGCFFNHVIICTAASDAFGQAMNAVTPGGTVLLYAFSEPGNDVSLDLHEYFRKGITLRSTYGASPLDLSEALRLLRFGRVAVKDLITHRMPLADTGKGFWFAASGAESLKVIIQPGR